MLPWRNIYKKGDCQTSIKADTDVNLLICWQNSKTDSPELLLHQLILQSYVMVRVENIMMTYAKHQKEEQRTYSR